MPQRDVRLSHSANARDLQVQGLAACPRPPPARALPLAVSRELGQKETAPARDCEQGRMSFRGTTLLGRRMLCPAYPLWPRCVGQTASLLSAAIYPAIAAAPWRHPLDVRTSQSPKRRFLLALEPGAAGLRSLAACSSTVQVAAGGVNSGRQPWRGLSAGGPHLLSAGDATAKPLRHCLRAHDSTARPKARGRATRIHELSGRTGQLPGGQATGQDWRDILWLVLLSHSVWQALGPPWGDAALWALDEPHLSSHHAVSPCGLVICRLGLASARHASRPPASRRWRMCGMPPVRAQI